MAIHMPIATGDNLATNDEAKKDQTGKIFALLRYSLSKYRVLHARGFRFQAIDRRSTATTELENEVLFKCSIFQQSLMHFFVV